MTTRIYEKEMVFDNPPGVFRGWTGRIDKEELVDVMHLGFQKFFGKSPKLRVSAQN